MSIIISKLRKEIPGVVTVSWGDSSVPWLKKATDISSRKEWIRSIIIHTHKGKLGKLLPGSGPNSTIDEALARYQVNTEREVSWDFTIDFNGDVTWQNDPVVNYTWQATQLNHFSMGFEMIQKDNGDLFEKQIEVAVKMIDYLTAVLGIQRQIPWDTSKNEPFTNRVSRQETGNKGSDCVGMFGHFHSTEERGLGDPGPYIFEKLKEAGYLLFDYNKKEDLIFWKAKQESIGIRKELCDGIAGPATIKKLKEAGYKHGMIVSRPIDSLITELE